MEEIKPILQLLNITTIEAYFRRDNVINEEYSKVKNNLELNTSKTFENDRVGVFLTVSLDQVLNDKKLVEVKVTTVGVFKKNGEISQIDLDKFCDVNAPAIIFPFIREIISNLSSKAGLQPIIIQPINFVQLKADEEKKANK